MKNNQTNNKEIKCLPEGGIRVQDGSLWIKIIKGIEGDKNRTPKTYTHKDILEFTNVKKAQLNHLVQTSTIKPQEEQKGRGGRSIYSYTNLLEVLFCLEMRKFSIDLHIVKNQIDWLRDKVWEFKFRAFWHQSPSIFDKECLILPSAADESLKITNEVYEKIERGDLPGEIKGTHTIWEYLRIYGFGTFYFVLGSVPINRKEIDEDNTKPLFYKADLYEAVEVTDVIKNNISSIVINLSALKQKVDLFRKG